MSGNRERRLFGTDGIRGVAGQPPLTPGGMARLGMAIGAALPVRDGRRFLVGRDTRLSCDMIEAALVSGLLAAGRDVVLAGVIPSPGVSLLVRTGGFGAGIMVSASHNPFRDNGVKIFRADGYKISDRQQAQISRLFFRDPPPPVATPGRASVMAAAADRYRDALLKAFPAGVGTGGLDIVVDAANGAASPVVAGLFGMSGVRRVTVIGDRPDGLNINEACGSVHPGEACRTVLARGADIGIVLDGDADRLILVDEQGEVVDGDGILGALAVAWHEAGCLSGGGVVGTVMTNEGLREFLGGHGLRLERAMVGDRHILARMRSCGMNLGGESSGHILATDMAATGDALRAALEVLALLGRKRQPASRLFRSFRLFPQENRTIPCHGPLPGARIGAICGRARKRLGGDGRLVVRPSGTEPVLRVMVEAREAGLAREVAGYLVQRLAPLAGS